MNIKLNFIIKFVALETMIFKKLNLDFQKYFRIVKVHFIAIQKPLIMSHFQFLNALTLITAFLYYFLINLFY